MTLGTLALSLATGILWADAGRESVPGCVIFASALIGCIATLRCARNTFCASRLSKASKASKVSRVSKFSTASTASTASKTSKVSQVSRVPRPYSGRARTLGFLAAGMIAFDAGHESLDARLRDAERDAARAQLAASEGIRIAEARVVSRRSGRWGDEIELAQVLAVDGGLTA